MLKLSMVPSTYFPVQIATSEKASTHGQEQTLVHAARIVKTNLSTEKGKIDNIVVVKGIE